MRIENLATAEELVAAARSGLYRLLVQGFGYPDAGLFALLSSGSFRRDVEEACQALPFAVSPPGEGLAVDGDRVEFQAEYLRSFEVATGAPPCPLYAGLYCGGRKAVMEELTRFYNYFGLSIERGGGELPDHVTTELEFMHFLAFKELWALNQGQDPSPYRRAQADFVERQLQTWLPQLRARLEVVGGPAFYSSLLDITNEFVAADAAYLRAALGGRPEVLGVQTVTHRAAGGDP